MAQRRIQHIAEYLGARAALFVVDLLPVGWSLATARGAGDLAFWLLGKRRRIAVENILRAKVARDEAEARRIARQSFRHFAMVAVEALVASRLVTPETLDEFVEIDLPPATAALVDDPSQGLLLVTGHLGNWEVVGHIISFRKRLVAVARGMNNPLTQKLMLERNSRRNIEIVGKHASDRHSLLRALRTGGSLGLMMDQHASSHGVAVPFFGIPAQTVTSPARLHLSTRCPIISGYGVRTGHMRFKIVYTEPYVFEPTGDRDADVHAILTELNRRLEEYIRLYPEQYLWSHRRWRAPATTAAPDTPSSAPPPSSETQPAPAESPRP